MNLLKSCDEQHALFALKEELELSNIINNNVHLFMCINILMNFPVIF